MGLGTAAMLTLDLTQPIFHDDDRAREHLESLLWPNYPICPRCSATEHRITKLKGNSTRPGVYKCKDCRKPFTVTSGTAIERSKVPLSKWVLAAQLVVSTEGGVSAKELQRGLKVTYETALFMHRRLRTCAIDLEHHVDFSVD